MAMTHRLVEHAITPSVCCMVEGSHLFPMERPQETAAAIEATLKALHNGGAGND
jgi:hypothetical protein